MIFILDIDDVSRNLRDKIIQSAHIYFRDENIGEYDYYNEKTREFMSWYYPQPFYHELYENCEPNKKMIEVVDGLYEEGIDVHFLSANQNEKAREITKKFINTHYYIKDNVNFVERWADKLPFVIENYYDLSELILVDDRLDTIRAFQEKGVKCFWYTEYLTPTTILSNISHLNFKPENFGNHDDFLKFVSNIILLSMM
jgi:hypothetical protein